jgi:DNA-directed RNA polymerase beta' subunit
MSFSDKWHYIEIYSKKLKGEDFELPIIKNSLGYIDKAMHYLTEKDNKAAAVYIRTEFERIIAKICEDKSLSVTYKSKKKDLSSEDLWSAIHQQTDIDETLVKEIETHRNTVMNPFSHFDIEKPEFERELTDTIDTIEKLKNINIKNLKKFTIEDLKKEKIASERKYVVQQTVANKLREVIKNKGIDMPQYENEHYLSPALSFNSL